MDYWSLSYSLTVEPLSFMNFEIIFFQKLSLYLPILLNIRFAINATAKSAMTHSNQLKTPINARTVNKSKSAIAITPTILLFFRTLLEVLFILFTLLFMEVCIPSACTALGMLFFSV